MRTTIRLNVANDLGTWGMAENVSETMIAERMPPPAPFPFGTGSMKEAVEVIRRREFRRKELRAHAIQLAERLADYIEDKEGWHGERRQELIAELEAKQP